jgi:hypothetical protein
LTFTKSLCCLCTPILIFVRFMKSSCCALPIFFILYLARYVSKKCRRFFYTQNFMLSTGWARLNSAVFDH